MSYYNIVSKNSIWQTLDAIKVKQYLNDLIVAMDINVVSFQQMKFSLISKKKENSTSQKKQLFCL